MVLSVPFSSSSFTWASPFSIGITCTAPFCEEDTWTWFATSGVNGRVVCLLSAWTTTSASWLCTAKVALNKYNVNYIYIYQVLIINIASLVNTWWCNQSNFSRPEQITKVLWTKFPSTVNQVPGIYAISIYKLL